MGGFAGFPPRVRFTPVPSPLFGPLLEQIDDLAELKATLRVIWALHEKRGYPRFVSLSSLLADRSLARALADGVSTHRALVETALARAVERGPSSPLPSRFDGGEERVYMLNTERDRKALAAITRADLVPMRLDVEGDWRRRRSLPTSSPCMRTTSAYSAR